MLKLGRYLPSPLWRSPAPYPPLPLPTWLLVAPTPAAATPGPAAADPPTPVDPVTIEAKRRDAQIVCKTAEVTGSLLGGKRTCLTRLQWEQQAADASRDLNHIQLQGSSYKSPN